MKILFLLNPNAGTPKDHDEIRRMIESIALATGLEADLEPSPTAEGVRSLVRDAVESGYDVVCAVGGDGTVHEVGRYLIGTDVALGIIPLGSGNGLARHLGIPCDVQGALETFTTPSFETIDTGLVDGRSFLGVCGVGLDGLVAHHFESSTTRGLRTYIKEGFSAWRTHERKAFAITIDGEAREVKAELIAFANSGQYGNEARIAPLASLRDGILDVAIVHETSLLTAPGLIYRLFTGNFHQAPGVTMLQGKRISVESEHAMPAHLDGDPVELPVRFEVILRERSLRVLIPDDQRPI